MNRWRTPETCPNCGAEVPARASACPECGSDERTGWSDEAGGEGLGLPDQEFDYDEFVVRELEGKPPRQRRGVFWWAVGAVVLLLFLWTMLGGVLRRLLP